MVFVVLGTATGRAIDMFLGSIEVKFETKLDTLSSLVGTRQAEIFITPV